MTNNVKIYFSDLNEKGQKKALEAAGVTDPKDCNWDMDIIPLAEFDIESEGEKL